MKPLCFVLMPSVPTQSGHCPVDFDAVYSEIVAPAVAAAGLDPLRGECSSSKRTAFEPFLMSEYAVADLTAAGAETFYTLGVRDAIKRGTTVRLWAASPGALPRASDVVYAVRGDGKPEDAAAIRQQLAQQLGALGNQTSDSGVFEIVDDFPDIERLKTDVFRDRVDYSSSVKRRLAEARRSGLDAVRDVERSLAGSSNRSLEEVEAAVLVDLLLSYRSARGFAEMVALVGRMGRPLAATPLVREQLALALNRRGDGEKAERILIDLLASRGSSSETCAILGRVYKDRWEEAALRGDDDGARQLLSKAIAAYLQGFETDWRDAFPGVNAVTLMELAEPPDPRRVRLLPVVAYAVDRRVESGRADYWDYAARIELAVLTFDEAKASEAYARALALVRESWEPESTARNLRLIREARARRGEYVTWAVAIEQALEQRAAR